MPSSRKSAKGLVDAAIPKVSIPYATPALDKGLDILEVLSLWPTGLTKSELARQLNRTISEIFRMLVCLERRGYVAQTASERYVLTLKMFQLVHQYPPIERLTTEALPIMKGLAQKVGQSCHLGVLDGDQVVILAQVNSATRLGFYVKLGSSVEILDSGSGYVVLAHLSERERQNVIARWTERTRRNVPKDLQTHLKRIRRAGFERRPSYEAKGVMNLSAPIMGGRESVLGALTIPYIEYADARITLEQTLQELRQAANEISSSLGGDIAFLRNE